MTNKMDYGVARKCYWYEESLSEVWVIASVSNR